MDISKFVGEKKNILDSFYSESKMEILGFNEYLKLDVTEQYKNNQNRLERIQKEKKLGWVIYGDDNKKISSDR